MGVKKLIALMLITLATASCGSEDEISVTLTPGDPNPFLLTTVTNIVFFVDDQATPDETVVFPQQCIDSLTGTLMDACGFDPDGSAEFRLDLNIIPSGATVVLTVQGRDDTGTVLYQGTSAPFASSANTSAVSINVSILNNS